jgi:hypothetical protein
MSLRCLECFLPRQALSLHPSRNHSCSRKQNVPWAQLPAGLACRLAVCTDAPPPCHGRVMGLCEHVRHTRSHHQPTWPRLFHASHQSILVASCSDGLQKVLHDGLDSSLDLGALDSPGSRVLLTTYKSPNTSPTCIRMRRGMVTLLHQGDRLVTSAIYSQFHLISDSCGATSCTEAVCPSCYFRMLWRHLYTCRHHSCSRFLLRRRGDLHTRP